MWKVELAFDEAGGRLQFNRLRHPQGGDKLRAKMAKFIEFTDSRLMCYHLHLKVVADSVPCSATNLINKL